MNLMNFLHRIFSISSACREHTQHTSNLDTIGLDVGVLIGGVHISGFPVYPCGSPHTMNIHELFDSNRDTYGVN